MKVHDGALSLGLSVSPSPREAKKLEDGTKVFVFDDESMR